MAKSRNKGSSKFKRFLAGTIGTLFIGTSVVGIGYATNENFKNKIDTIRNKIVSHFKDSKQSLKTRIDELIKKIENLTAKNEEDIKNYTAQIENLQAEKTTLESEKESLQKELAEKQARLEELEAQGVLDSEEVERLNKEIIAINNRINELEARVSALENQEISLRNTIAELEKTLDDLNLEVDKLWNIFENYQDYVESTENGETVEVELTEEEKQIIEEKIEELENEVINKTNDITDLETQKTEIQNNINDLTNEKTEVENNINDYQEQRNEINNDITELDSTNQNIQTTINSNNEVIEELESLGSEITEEQQTQLDNLKTENETLHTQINNNNTLISTKRVLLTSIQLDINNANIELDSLEARIELLETNYSALDLQVQALNRDITGLQNQINSFDKFLKKANGEEHNHIVSESIIENYTETEETITYDKVVYCSTCSEEISRETITEEKHVHTAGEVVQENYNETNISETDKVITYEEVTYCTGCSEELSRVEKSEEVHTHIAGEFVQENYVESETGFTLENARYCLSCGKEVERKQTVFSVSEFGATINTPEHNFPILEMYSKETVEAYLKANNIEYGYLEESENPNSESIIFARNNDKYYIIETYYEATDELIGYMLDCYFYNSFELGRDIVSIVGNPRLIILELRQRPEHKEYGFAMEFISNYNETEESITYDKVVYCCDCGQEISRDTIKEEKLFLTVNAEYVGSKTVEYRTGQTWLDWINSDFNKSGNPFTNKVTFTGQYIYSGYSVLCIDSLENKVTINDVLDPTKTYMFIDFTKTNINTASVSFKDGVNQFEYTGESIDGKFELVVTLDGKELAVNDDYTLSFSSGSNYSTYGDVNVGMHTIKLSGIGMYSGETYIDYEIIPASIANAVLVYSGQDWAYGLSSLNSNIMYYLDVTINGKDITNHSTETNYSLYWVKGEETGTVIKDAGTYTVYLVGEGNYTGTSTQSFIVTVKRRKISSVNIVESEIIATGENLIDTIEVKYDKTLVLGKDYSIVWKNTAGEVVTEIIEAGEYTAEIKILETGNYSYDGDVIIKTLKVL